MRRLYFMRHGQSVFNVEGRFAGLTDAPLTEEGRRQAKKAGQAAKDLGIDLIVSSPLSRALDTARIVAEEIGYPPEKIITSILLMEQYYGSLEGQLWSPDLDMDGVADLETDNWLVERAHLALKWINSFDAERILVASHGSFGRALRSILKAEYPMSHPEGINNAEILAWVEED